MTTINHEVTAFANFEQPEDLVGEQLTASQFPSIYGNKEFIFDVTFEYEGPFGNPTPVSNTNVTASPDYVNVTVLSDNVVRIVFLNSPFDESFSFTDLNTLKSGDATQELVDIGTIDSYNSSNKILVGWNTPDEDIVNEDNPVVGAFSFELQVGAGIVTANYFQNYYWSYEVGFEKFKTLQETATIEPTQDYDFENPDTTSQDAIADSLNDDKYVFDESRVYNPE